MFKRDILFCKIAQYEQLQSNQFDKYYQVSIQGSVFIGIVIHIVHSTMSLYT